MNDAIARAQAIQTLRKRKAVPSTRMPFHEYIPKAWQVLEPKTVFKPNWHIDAMADHLEAVIDGQIRNLIINIPPRCMKSLSVSVFFPTWVWTWAPHIRWMFSSYAEPLSIRDSVKCRRLIQSPWYQRNWGSVFAITSDQNQKIRFENDEFGFRVATSVGGLATGEGADTLVVDDPHKVKDIISDPKRLEAITWWKQTMSTRLNDPSTGHKIIIMQRLHDRDLTGEILHDMLEDGEEYEQLVIPMEWEGEDRSFTSLGFTDPRTEFGELMWPDRYDRTSVNVLKTTLGSYDYSGQMQQNPSPFVGGMFKKYNWRFWYPIHLKDDKVPRLRSYPNEDGDPVYIQQAPIPLKMDRYFQSWDLSFKGEVTSDDVAGHLWGKAGANLFLLHRVTKKMDIIQTIASIMWMTNLEPRAVGKYVENKANGPAVITLLKNKVPGLILVEPMGSKVERGLSAVPMHEAGNIWLPHPALHPWVSDFIETAAKFPATDDDHDIDALTQAVLKSGLMGGSYSAPYNSIHHIAGSVLGADNETRSTGLDRQYGKRRYRRGPGHDDYFQDSMGLGSRISKQGYRRRSVQV